MYMWNISKQIKGDLKVGQKPLSSVTWKILHFAFQAIIIISPLSLLCFLYF